MRLSTFATAVLLLGSTGLAHADLVISPSGDQPDAVQVSPTPSAGDQPTLSTAPSDEDVSSEVILTKKPAAMKPHRATVPTDSAVTVEDEANPTPDEVGGSLSDQIAQASKRIVDLPTGDGVPLTTPTLRQGSQGHAVAALAHALSSHGFLVADQADSTRMGSTMVAAVREAQDAYGLQADGVASDQLYLNLSASADERAAAFHAWQATVDDLVNQARAQGLSKIVVVNVPSFTLRAIDVASGKTVVQSRVIVGRPERATPLESINIVGIKYNPNWTPPPTIVKKDILPNLGRPSSYFQHHGLIITNAQGQRVNPASLSASEFLNGHYRVQQPAGDENALGILKFETDSRQNIYLHDTNERPIFKRANRAYSSGCVRVQDFMDLATFVSDQPDQTIQHNLDTGRTYIARTPKVPVFFTYSRADVSRGRPTLFPDVYHRGPAALILAR